MWRNPLVREAMAVGRPIALYWTTVALGLIVFTVSVWFTQDNGLDSKDFAVLAGIWASAFAGVFVGQLASLTRLRSGLFLPMMFTLFWFAVYVLAAYEKPLRATLGEIPTIFLILSLMLGSIFGSGGFWSLRVNRGLLAAWAPAILFTGSILMVTEDSGRVDAWHEGAKYAIWSFGTISVLGVAILLQLAFMAGRERHRIHRWRTAPSAPELVEQRADPFRPLAGIGTLFVLGLLVVALTASSAVVAPYLWRTGPGDDDGGGGQTMDEPDDLGDPAEGGGGGGMQQVGKYVKQGVQMGCALMTMLVLSIAGLIVFGLPTRRQLLLSHLRDPMWPVPPSRRARLHWRLAELALGDAGIHRRPGDSARDVALRAVERFPEVNLDALVTAAEIADRVMYGYALDAGDADTIRRAAEMTYQAVWDNLGETDRLKATYRLL